MHRFQLMFLHLLLDATFSSAGSTNSLAIDNNSEQQNNQNNILEIMIPSSEQTVANKVGQWRANYRNNAEPGYPPNIETAMFCYTSTSAISNITFISPSGNSVHQGPPLHLRSLHTNRDIPRLSVQGSHRQGNWNTFHSEALPS